MFKVDYKTVNAEWDKLKLLDNSKPNWDKKWLFIYNLTLQYAKAMLSRQNRYVDDIDDRVLDQVSRVMERMRDEGWTMESAKYCSFIATAAVNNRTAQEKFNEKLLEEIDGLNPESEWDNYFVADY